MPDHGRKERIARNQALLRPINETLEHGLRRVPMRDPELIEFVCECAHLDCGVPVYVEKSTYTDARSDERRFLIAPGHDVPDVEDVVEQGDDYVVVQKHEDVRHIVER